MRAIIYIKIYHTWSPVCGWFLSELLLEPWEGGGGRVWLIRGMPRPGAAPQIGLLLCSLSTCLLDHSFTYTILRSRNTRDGKPVSLLYNHTYEVPTMCILGTMRTLTKEAKFLPQGAPQFFRRGEEHTNTPGRPKRASRKGGKLVRTKFRVVNHSLLGGSKWKVVFF